MRAAKRPEETESTHEYSRPCKLRKLNHTENETEEISANLAGICSNNRDIKFRSRDNTTCEEIKFTSIGELGSNQNFVDVNTDFALNFEAQIKQLLNDVVVSEEEAQDTISKILGDLRTETKGIGYPHEFLPFGSYINGLSWKESDVDICLKPLTDIKDLKPSMNFLSKRLRRSRLFSHIIYIKTARVPLIKLIHKATKRSCDISFSNEIGVRNTLLMKFYLSLNTNIKPLILFLKHLLKIHDIHGPGKMSTYMLFWLTVYYMQKKDVLPPVMNVRNLTEERVFVSGWDCSVPECFTVPVTDRYSLFSHVKEFLKFYSDFEFMKFVISPYLACEIPADCFENLKIPTDIFSSYLEKLEKESDVKFSLGLINVQDPFMHNFNLTKSMGQPFLNKFKVLCVRAYKYLNEDFRNKKANCVLRTLSIAVSHKSNPPDHCLQYMTIHWDFSKLPERILNLYKQQGIMYLCNGFRTILETELNCNVEIVFSNDTERMCRKDNKLQKIVAPLCFLTCAMKEHTDAKLENQTKSSKTFLILETTNTGQGIHISVEGGVRVINFLKKNLFNLFVSI